MLLLSCYKTTTLQRRYEQQRQMNELPPAEACRGLSQSLQCHFMSHPGLTSHRSKTDVSQLFNTTLKETSVIRRVSALDLRCSEA